tara:strand:- start:213 stop:641 length:429 start_codon:yes stop_codon:yes gene_type:complete
LLNNPIIKMKPIYSPKNNPRVIIIQILYSKYYNDQQKLIIPKHRFKKFIKDVVTGTIERDEVILAEIKKNLNSEINFKKLDKVFLTILKSAIFEVLYKPTTSSRIIIKEYLNASNYFVEDSKTKYLNALLDKISKNIRLENE